MDALFATTACAHTHVPKRGRSALYPAGQFPRELARLFVARTLRLGGDDEPYLLAAAPYVELNPVRARLAEQVGDWRWSSAGAHLDGRDDALARVAPLLALAPDWAAFLAGGLGAEEHAAIRAGERTGRPLGSAAFTARIERRLGRTLARRKPGPKPATIDPAKGTQT
jgi:hypothetical protein